MIWWGIKRERGHFLLLPFYRDNELEVNYPAPGRIVAHTFEGARALLPFPRVWITTTGLGTSEEIEWWEPLPRPRRNIES